MNGKITSLTLPIAWRQELVQTLRFPPVRLEWTPVTGDAKPWDALSCVTLEMAQGEPRFALSATQIRERILRELQGVRA